MEPLEILRNEHGLIRQFVDNLSMAGEKMAEGERVPTEFFAKAVLFSKTFADEFHHPKEEYVMFVRLAQKKGGAMDGEIESLRHQHEHAGNYMSAISSALNGYDEGNPMRTSDILENMGAYIIMERAHIHKEDHVFFPMVAEEFSDDEMDQVKAEFEKVKEKAGGEKFEEAHKLIVEMGSILQHMN
jgi:hemerythrin-like domain-containing protein